MDQKVWGPHTWFFLHSVTFNYPFKPTNEDKEHIAHFFKEIEDILPCSVCRRHYKEHLKKKPIQNKDRKVLAYWLIDLHNIVNIQEHKPTMSYQAVVDMYSNAYKKQIVLEDPADKSHKTNDEFSLYTDRKRFANREKSIGKLCAADNKCMEFNIWYIFLVGLVLALICMGFTSCLFTGRSCERGNGGGCGKGRGRGKGSCRK